MNDKKWFAKLDENNHKGFRLVEFEWTQETASFCDELNVSGYRMFFTKKEAISWLRNQLQEMANSIQDKMRRLDYLS